MNNPAKAYLPSGVGTSCGLWGPRWVDKTMLISNEIKKTEYTHTGYNGWAN